MKPNISYVLDTSGSMQWTHAPDESQPWVDNVGYKTSQCNSIYYDPSILYPPARNYDGTTFPNSSFTSAWVNGYNTGSGTVNLSSSYYAYDNTSSNGAGQDTLQPAYYYNYLGTQVATGLAYQNSSSTFYKECNANETAMPTATIVFSGSSNTSVTGITVSGTQIMSGATASTTSSTTLATTTAAKITASGYSATASGSTVTITGPLAAGAVLPVVTTSPPIPTATITFSGTNFTSVTGVKVNGIQIMSGGSTLSNSPNTVAASVAGLIGLAGFSATASGAVVTINGPFLRGGLYARGDLGRQPDHQHHVLRVSQHVGDRHHRERLQHHERLFGRQHQQRHGREQRRGQDHDGRL